MSMTATRPMSPEATEAHAEAPWPEPLPSYDPLAGNPVARAHARRGGASSAAEGSPIGRILLWTIAIPAMIFLVSNPLGWLLLFLMCLGIAVLTGFGGIL